jgi:hypothetical protein
VVFRSKGIVQEATAVKAASLEIDTGPGEVLEKRRITAPQLRFGFDELGRLVSLQGLPSAQTGPRAPGQAVLTTEPVPPASPGARLVRGDTFAAALDPESGALR